VVLVAVALAAGGSWIYRNRLFPEPQAELPPVVTAAPVVAEAVTLSAIGSGVLAGPPGAWLPLEVRAVSGSAPLSDSLVYFEVLAGDGVVDPAEIATNADGVARTALTLPDRPGTVVVVARLAGAGAEVRLTATVEAGVPHRIVSASGDEQRELVGELLPERVAVVVYDASGIPVPGAEVRFAVASGGGMAAPSRDRTDSTGAASALWRLGDEVGEQTLSAMAAGVDQAVRFTAIAEPLPVATDGNPLPVETGPVTVAPAGFVVGGSHVCSLGGGTARCRGANDRGQLGSSGAAGLVAMASGISHVCGLSAAGEALCWGANEGGQLGDGSRTDRRSAVPVRVEVRFGSLTAGAAHSCGLAGGGIPFCWGQNLNGQLGDGSRTDARFPRAVGGGLRYRTLVAGWNHTCGIADSGNAFCWGLNSDGQLGDGSRVDRLVPVLARGAVESLAAGSAHTCGVSGGEVLCWGDNRFGQLGDGSTEGRPQPVAVRGLPAAATHVVAGAVHTCALVTGGSAYCWGQNLHGQLGDGTTTSRNTAVAVEGGLQFRSIHAGGALTCGFTTEGAEYCWGFNLNGELGDGTRDSRSRPTAVGG
jgi:hypothetical protein